MALVGTTVLAARAAEFEPLTVTVDVARRRMNISRSAFYNLLRQGKVRAVKSGRRTLVIWRSVIDYLDGLPPASFGTTDTRVSVEQPGSPETETTATVATSPCRGRRS